MASWLIVIAGGRVNDEVALVAKEPRAKLFVFAELSGIHGALVTRRSFGSACWPGVATGTAAADLNSCNWLWTFAQAFAFRLVAYGASGSEKKCKSSVFNSGVAP